MPPELPIGNTFVAVYFFKLTVNAPCGKLLELAAIMGLNERFGMPRASGFVPVKAVPPDIDPSGEISVTSVTGA